MPPRRVRFRTSVLSIVALLMLALACRLYAASGEMGPDCLAYAQYAYQVIDGQFSLSSPAWYAHRLPVFLPVALLYALFGVSVLTSTVWPVLLSMASVGVGIALGWRLAGPAAGHLAGYLLAISPLEAIYGSKLLPDPILGGFLAIAVLLWIDARKDEGTPHPGRLLLAGLALGLAVTTRPYALILLLLFALDRPRSRGHLRALVGVVAGGLIVMLPLLVAYALETGDPLYRMRVVGDTYASGRLAEGGRWMFYPQHVWSPRALTGFFPPLFLLAFFLALWRRDGRRTLLILWIALFALFLQWGSMSPREFVPILKRTRFLGVLSVPATVLTAAILAEWLWRREVRGLPRWLTVSRRRAVLFSGLAVLTFGALDRIHVDRVEGRDRRAAVDAIVDELRQHPEEPVLLDHWRSAMLLAFHLSYAEGANLYGAGDDDALMQRERIPEGSRLSYLLWHPALSAVPAGYVLVDERTPRRFRERIAPEQDCWKRPPDSWRPVLSRAGFHLYRVAEGEGVSPRTPSDSG